MNRLYELGSFLIFWPYDLILEAIYAIFRCRPRKEIKGENILITGTGTELNLHEFIEAVCVKNRNSGPNGRK